ncbi:MULTISPECIES: tyrosine-type recombinase/integrase [unclassified Rhodanobacter]|uniref:tyrosine-type recombinase/integrase n=1 Tax=unclassified Rhodanobacter TaxID=2621553 RepID=UPI000B33DE11|nr:tyrosine-type recombinase/integrase [Rhodanobacter sp. FW510-R10]
MARYPPLPWAAERAQLKAKSARGADTAKLPSAPDSVVAGNGRELSPRLVDRLRIELTPEQEAAARAGQAERVQLDIRPHAPNSVKGLASDWLNWLAFCLHYDRVVLPSAFADVVQFIDIMIACGRKKATLEHHLWSITQMNWRCHCPDPMDGQNAQGWWRGRVRDKLSGEQKQAKPFGLRAVEQATTWLRDADSPRPTRRAKKTDHQVVEVAQRRRDLRDAALINTAYDLMMRSAELVSAEWGRLTWASDGSGTYRFGKTKTDQVGTGVLRYLRPETMNDLDAWRAVAGPSPFIFHAVRERDADHEPRPVPASITSGTERERYQWPPLSTQEVGVIFRRSARLAGVKVEHLSGHSTRVAGAQDMVEAGATNAEVQQAGGWKDPRMPAKYAGQPEAKRAGERRFRKLQRLRHPDD